MPKTLTVVDPGGAIRPLLSYKTANDILVVGFYDPRCAQNQIVWHDLKVLFDAYKDWHVTFLGVSGDSAESLSELTGEMSKAGLIYIAVRDADRQSARKLHVTALPEIVVIDEWGQLRYRGPVAAAGQSCARQAIEAVIGHVDPVPQPEPADPNGCPLVL